ncbi:inner centromere protein A-like [Capsella rubella]|uniref:inner centromere protein A-like n=1 Tax=Capsella rubella TaxID=81985 RepID=UPI000CD55CDE|nr:inner centromere protein A-like [Capsella rubella]
MADFPGVMESIGQDAWDDIKQLPLGIVAKLVESKFVWSAKTVHYLLYRQLRIKHKEIWCLVGGQPIRFGFNEFAHLTGLNIDPTPSEKFEPSVDYKQFLTEELKVPGGEAAKIVSDDKAVKAYPWGRVAFETIVDNVKCLNPRGSSYTLGGPVYVLQAWAYDSIKCLGERFRNFVENEEIPLFRWPGTRTRSALDEAIAKDIKKYSERVSKMVMKGDVMNEDKQKAGKVRAAVESESPAKKQKEEKGGDSGAKDAQKKKKKKINEPHEQKNKKKKSEKVKADSEEDDAGGKASLKLLVEFIKMKGLFSFVARGGGLAGLMSGGKNILHDDTLPLKNFHEKKIQEEEEEQVLDSDIPRCIKNLNKDFDEATNKNDGLLDFIEKSPSPANKKMRHLTRNLEAQQRKEAEAQKKKEEEKKRAEAEARRKGNEEKGQPKKRGRKPRGVQQVKPSVPSDMVEEIAEDVVKIPLVKFKFPKEEKKQVGVEDNKGDNKGDNKACDSEVEDVTDNNPFENFNVLLESDVDEKEKIRNERIKGLIKDSKCEVC